MTTAIQTTLASAARTVTGSADIGAMPNEYTEAIVYIDVTAVEGTSPTMTVTYQSSPDGVTFYDHTAGAEITATGKQRIAMPNTIGRFGRLSYAIGGTNPSFTFSAVIEFKRP